MDVNSDHHQVSKSSSVARVGASLLNVDTTHLTSRYDPIYRAIWCTIKSSVSPFFTLSLLTDIRSFQDNIAQYCSEHVNQQPKYIIWMSDHPKIFSLGIDLKHIYHLILSKDEEKLNDYMQLCIDVFYINLMKLDISPLITISLISGKAYGGGFESALSSDVVVAEHSARCCFPEARYHLLPSFGSLRMLLRRYDYPTINKLLFESRCLDLHSLQRFGFIDTIVSKGEGRSYIQKKIEKIHHRHEIYSALYDEKMKSIIITFQELDDFRHKWVNSALRLKSADLHRLGRLVTVTEKK